MKPIYKLFYRIYRVISATWYWAHRRFTLPGLCVAGGLVIAAGVGTDIQNTVTYQLFALLLAFLILAFFGSRFFRAKFSATRSLPRFGTAGQPLHYCVLIKNLAAQPQKGLTLLEDLADPRPTFQEWLALQLAEMRAHAPVSRDAASGGNQSVPAGEPQGGGSPAAFCRAAKRKCAWNSAAAARDFAFHRRDAGAAGSAGIVPLVCNGGRAADGFDFAEALSAAAHRAARRDEISGRRRGARGERRAAARNLSRCANTGTAIRSGTSTGGAGPRPASPS
jgi:hypothetical protein